VAAAAAEPRPANAKFDAPLIDPKLLEKTARLARDLESLEARWLEVATAIEAAEAEGMEL